MRSSLQLHAVHTVGYELPMTPVTRWKLAQVNIGITVAPLDDEQLREFVDNLEPINALAQRSAGFVWRLQDEGGDATAARGFGDDRILINLTVWDSVEALADFVFRTDHAAYLRRRREWFVRMQEAITVLWWIPTGTVPTVAEAEERLDALRRDGATPFAFTFRTPFPAPGSAPGLVARDDWFCPA